VSEKLIEQAIRERRNITFLYSGDMRKVEPHLLGITLKNVLTLSGWQTEGPRGDGWRGYHVNKISDLKILDENFHNVRPGYNPHDSTMAKIICRV